MNQPRRFVLILFTEQSTECELKPKFFDMMQGFEWTAYLASFNVSNLPGLIELFALTSVPSVYVEDLDAGGVYRFPGDKMDLAREFITGLLEDKREDSSVDEVAARRSAHRAQQTGLKKQNDDRRTKIV